MLKLEICHYHRYQGLNKPVSELSEEEKQAVSALATLAAGLAGGLITDSSRGTVAAAQAAENNLLAPVMTPAGPVLLPLPATPQDAATQDRLAAALTKLGRNIGDYFSSLTSAEEKNEIVKNAYNSLSPDEKLNIQRDFERNALAANQAPVSIETLAKQNGFGSAFVRGASERTDQYGNKVYVMDKNGAGNQVKQGDLVSIAGEYLLVFSKEGYFMAALNADGTKNTLVSEIYQGRELNLGGVFADSHSSGNNNSSKPNFGKKLTSEQKKELGGSISGTPGGWEPQDEENARNKGNNKFDRFRKDDLISSANEPINEQGLSAAARAWEKHVGRPGGAFEPLKGNPTQKSKAANQFVNEVLNNKNTVKTDLSRGGVEYILPDGRGVRYNSDGSFSGFLDPKNPR